MNLENFPDIFFEHRTICTADASLLALLLRSIGVPSQSIILKDKEDANKLAHAVVRIKLDGKELYSDPTTVRMMLQIQPDIKIDTLVTFSTATFFSVIHKNKIISFEVPVASLEDMFEAAKNSKGMSL